MLSVKTDKVGERVEDQFEALPFSAATVKQDVDLPVVQYVLENSQDSCPA